MNKEQTEKRYFIYTRNQAGTTLYNIGICKDRNDAHIKALKGYGWYRVEPEKYEIVAEEIEKT